MQFLLDLLQVLSGFVDFREMSSTIFQKSGKKTPTSADWFLDPQELSSKFNSKTKAIIINTPNNPIGKVRSHPVVTC